MVAAACGIGLKLRLRSAGAHEDVRARGCSEPIVDGHCRVAMASGVGAVCRRSA